MEQAMRRTTEREDQLEALMGIVEQLGSESIDKLETFAASILAAQQSNSDEK